MPEVIRATKVGDSLELRSPDVTAARGNYGHGAGGQTIIKEP